MPKLQLALRLYTVGVAGAGAVALALVAAVSPAFSPDHLLPFLILLALTSVAALWPVHISTKYKVVVTDTATFAAALILPAPLAMLVAGAGSFAGQRFRAHRRPVREIAFNSSVQVIGTGLAAAVYAEFAGPLAPVVAHPFAAAAAAVMKYLVETGIVDVGIALRVRRDPLAAWWPVHRRDLPQHVALYLLGVLAALVATTQPWALLLFGVPMGTTLLTLRESMRLRIQTRQAILELADLMDLRDPYTHGHSERVAAVAERLGRRLGMQHGQLELVREAARLHDIGKIGTDDHVLQKPGPLDEHELVAMRKHAEFGAKLLRALPEFWEGATLVLDHHERYDGTGYPRGLKGDDIPYEALVISISDVYDALSTDRPYRKALSWDQTRAELLRGRGTHWSGQVVDTFIEMIEEERRVAAPAPAARAPAAV